MIKNHIIFSVTMENVKTLFKMAPKLGLCILYNFTMLAITNENLKAYIPKERRRIEAFI